jgi:hypothetical protein
MFLLGVCRTKRFNLTRPKKPKGYPNQAGHEQFGKSSSSKENGFKGTLRVDLRAPLAHFQKSWTSSISFSQKGENCID